MSGNHLALMHKRLRATEKTLQLELAAADLMDDLLLNWAGNMRALARHNVALTTVLGDILHLCHEAGVDLGELGGRAEMIAAGIDPDD